MPQANNPTSRNVASLWLFSALFAVAAGAIFFFAARDLGSVDSVSAALEVGMVEVIGDPLVPHTSPDPAVGLQAPALITQTFSGEQFDLEADGETVRVIGFFAHWCPHCQAELPVVAEWLDESGLPEDVEVIAVSTAVDAGSDNYPPSAWFAREAWPGQVIVDDADNTIAATLGVTAFPFWVVLDGDGAVAARVPGAIDPDSFENFVRELSEGART